MEQKHGEDDISNVDKNLSISVTQYSATLTSRGTISQFLVKLELNQYVKIFKENHIEMKVLLDLRPEEFMDMSKELEMNTWAHRHKIKRALEEYKAESADNLIISNDSEVLGKSTEDQDDELQDSCEFCKNGSHHSCKVCLKVVCVLRCSVPDPNSENESHRIHRPGDSMCLQTFECPTCRIAFVSANVLQVHIAQEHESSLSSLSLITNDNTESWKYVVCKICTLKF